jgi:hypothetical protein
MMWMMLACYCIFLLGVGYALPYWNNKPVARATAWMIVITTVIVSTLLSWKYPPLVRMITIVFLQLVSMKVVVMVETYSGENRLTLFQWIAFAIAWFGMRPSLFEQLPASSLPSANLLIKGVSRIIIGILLLYGSQRAEQVSLSAFFIPQLLLLAGLSLILHFGILNLSTAVWRACGVNVSELFRAPYRSRSLKEFWGKRWNIAFSEMTALIAYRPLKAKIGVEQAVVLSFLFSGLLHEIAISLPVHAGYGFPMLYFVIHAVAMQLEAKSSFVKKIINHQTVSHLWVMMFLILPMPLLFRPEFIQQVLIPLRTLVLEALMLG